MSLTVCRVGIRPPFSYTTPIRHSRRPRQSAQRCTASSEESAQKYRWNLDAKPNPHKRGRSYCLMVQALTALCHARRSKASICAIRSHNLFYHMLLCIAGDLIDLPLQAIRRPLGRTRSNGKHTGRQNHASVDLLLQVACLRLGFCRSGQGSSADGEHTRNRP